MRIPTISYTICLVPGDYMEIQMSFDALPGMVIVMTSPDFPRGDHHCLNFEYEVRARLGMPLLEIHARITDYMLSGDIIWSSNQQISHRSSANVTVQAVEISALWANQVRPQFVWQI